MSRFNGDFHKGSLDIEDDYGICLTCWWMPKRDFKKGTEKEKAVQGFVGKCECERFQLEKDDIESFRIYQDGGWQQGVILYQLTDERAAMLVSNMMNTRQLLTTALPLKSPQGLWNYSLYAIKFAIPENFRLDECVLAAGCQKFVFTKKNLHLTVWVISLFRRLLEDRSPAQWAMDFVEMNFRKQYRFRKETRETDVFFDVAATRRKRWLVSVKHLLFGNLKAQLVGKILGDQLYIAFFEYRKKASEELMVNLVLGDVR